MQNSYTLQKTNFYPLGIYMTKLGLHVSAVFNRTMSNQDNFGIVIYDKQNPEGISFSFSETHRMGNVYAMLIAGYTNKDFTYLLFDNDKLLCDPYAKAVQVSHKYGIPSDKPNLCKIYQNEYDWSDDCKPVVNQQERLLYLLHSRGFTKHKSSGVSHKGTFLGISEKCDYLKSIGVTSILLMPSYEFEEVMKPDKKEPLSMEEAVANYTIPLDDSASEIHKPRINYWGYTEGQYFTPKAAYAGSKDAVKEFKDMVKELHNNNIEVFMQFFFPPTINKCMIPEILKFWVVEYHIDGFHLLGSDIPMNLLYEEPLLTNTVLISDNGTYPSYSVFYTEKANVSNKNLFYMNESFLYDLRKLLKGDDSMISCYLHHVRSIPEHMQHIHYIAKWDGFRLLDLVSYDRKHNEENRENNRDGSDYNFSWNCGIEGKTKKKTVLSLRLRQIKNALSLLMLIPGVPLIYSGDEFGQTQNGNNNPYCQDNATTWINWKDVNEENEILAHFKMLQKLRKEHSVWNSITPLSGVDTSGCGYPEISFHGEDAWKPDTNPNDRTVGIMLHDTLEEQFFYHALNMHWESHHLGVPKLPKGYSWELLFTTYQDSLKPAAYGLSKDSSYQSLLVPPRAIMVYIAKKAE